MHLLIVHQNFADPKVPGGTRHFELARHLVRSGHQCTIIAGSVDFMSGKALPREPVNLDGVVIRRAYAFPTIHHSYLGRAASYLCFMFTCVWVGLRVGRVDAVMGTSPPMFQLPSAWLIARLRRRPFILEIRDLWPDFAVELGVLRNPLLIGVARRVERFFYRTADWVVINSPGFREHLLKEGANRHRLTVVPNGVETSMFDPTNRGEAFRDKLGLSQENFVAIYAGSLGRANDLSTLVRAAKRLEGLTDLRVVIVGDGKERAALESEVSERQAANVVLAGHVPKAEIGNVLGAANVCVATLQDVPMFKTVYPNKVFDYMAAGRPTVLAIDGVIREVIESSNGGIYVRSGDDAALADAIRGYHDDPERAHQNGVSARAYVEQHFERGDQAAEVEQILAALAARPRYRGWYRNLFKRLIDLSLALPALIVLSPVILFVYLLVRVKLGAPAIFRQVRGGKGGRRFMLYKFRTMLDAFDAEGKPLPDEERLTPFGQRLRSLSLDELPQLWNIVKGDMSLIGPRPLLERYLDRYSAEQARRHDVRPGITGWAQINGRNAISWDEKFKLDVWYVDHCRFSLDVKILLATFGRVLKRDGISAGDHATMPEFMGNADEAESLSSSS